MREPFHQLYVHLVWATWDRLPLLRGERLERVCACVQAECERLNVAVIAMGGVADHLHLLVRIPTTMSVATLAKQVKGASSHLATHEMSSERFFKWQGGYGAFTVSKSDASKVRDYILRQEEHHANKTFDPECEPE